MLIVLYNRLKPNIKPEKLQFWATLVFKRQLKKENIRNVASILCCLIFLLFVSVSTCCVGAMLRVDAVVGIQHLVLPEHLPAVLHWAAVPLPLQDAGGETS